MNPIIYEVIIFDWDGTAVPDRHAPIDALKSALEQLLKEGATCAIVTGTNLNNILSQGIQDLSAFAKQGLHLCTNRGSEVYGFASDGQPRLNFRRQATSAESTALDRTAQDFCDQIKAKGLQTEIIFDRLNRRKVDLIPEKEWVSPKKAQFRELLSAVESRLRAAGLTGGLHKLLELTEAIARQQGLPAPKITSDIKHIEIGLTDKGDSARWIVRNLIEPDKFPLSKVSVWGDELGSLGSLPGSDALMRIPELENAFYFSVGIEPEGVPPWANHVGGGPDRFIEFLLEQARLRRAKLDIPYLESSQDKTWILENIGFDATQERFMETLFAVSNGSLGVRGASDLPIPAAQADLFIAGIYDERVSSQPYSEVELADSSPASGCMEAEIVPFPSPFRFSVRLDGKPIQADTVNRPHYKRCLDYEKGVYFEDNLLESPLGQKIRLSSFRICSHADAHLLVQSIKLGSEDFSGPIDVDLSICPEELAELYPHLKRVTVKPPGQSTGSDCELLTTLGSKEFVALACRITVNGRELNYPMISTRISAGEQLQIEKRISVFWSKDPELSKSLAIAHSKSLPRLIDSNIDAHVKEWSLFWDGSDLAFPSDAGLTDAFRFSLYHLQSCAARGAQSSIPAKGLTGRAYEGHIFWDTEIFIFPFFLYTNPAIARELLFYRYKTLPGARRRAAGMGFPGACYAWESTVSGLDVTPSSVSISGKDSKSNLDIPIFTGPQELHITADVAWAVFKYWDATLDQSFMCDYGVEILIETARFWVSRLTLSGGLYHLRTVVGPDEYHHSVNDNAFTNWMVRFNLEVAIQMVKWVSEEHPERWTDLAEKLRFTLPEIANWRDVLNLLYIPGPDSNGVIEQFEGFFDLKPVSLSPRDKSRAPISRLFDWKTVDQTRIVKQADVLMITFLFPDQLPLSVVRANYDYYEPMTDHGSSLSSCVHAAIAAHIGKTEDSLHYWKESLYFDLHNVMSNSQLGIHAAALGGTWQAFVFHLLNIRLSETGVRFEEGKASLLPSEWNGLTIKLKYRSRTYSLVLTSGKLIESNEEAA